MFPMGTLEDSTGWAWLAVGIIFALVLAGFAGKRTGLVLLGFLRVAGAFVTEPVGHLNRILYQFTSIGSAGLAKVAGPKRGLLATCHFYLQMAMAVGAIGIFALGAVVAWKVFLPAAGAEERLDTARKGLETTRQGLAALREQAGALDAAMPEKATEHVALFKAQRLKTIQDAAQAMASAEKEAQTAPIGVTVTAA